MACGRLVERAVAARTVYPDTERVATEYEKARGIFAEWVRFPLWLGAPDCRKQVTVCAVVGAELLAFTACVLWPRCGARLSCAVALGCSGRCSDSAICAVLFLVPKNGLASSRFAARNLGVLLRPWGVVPY